MKRWVALTLLGFACGRTTMNTHSGDEGGAASRSSAQAGGTGPTLASGGFGGTFGGTATPPSPSAGMGGEPAPVDAAGASGEAMEASSCGDGELYPDEACDDGNDVDSDGCDADCSLTRVVELTAGAAYTCARFDSGRVKCWGDNAYGCVGIGAIGFYGDSQSETPSKLPFVDLGTDARAKAIRGGSSVMCVLLESERIVCWGFGDGTLGVPYLGKAIGNAPGQMGDALIPVDIGSHRTPKGVSVGFAHACALLSDESVKCWGGNWAGQLGQGDTETHGNDVGEMGDALDSIDWGLGRKVRSVVAGASHTCVLLTHGAVKCIGAVELLGLGPLAQGNLGDETSEHGDAIPTVDLGTGRSARALAAGDYHTCAILDDDTVKCWGYNYHGELGLEDDVPLHGYYLGDVGNAIPVVNLGTGRTALSIAAGARHTCAILDDQSLKCWGQNVSGSLGLGDTDPRGGEPHTMGDALPVVALGTGRHAVKLALGADHTCAILDDGSVKCWGAQGPAALGYGTNITRGDEPGEMGDALPAVQLW